MQVRKFMLQAYKRNRYYFFEIDKFTKKKILEPHQDYSNEESEAEQTGDEGNVNDTYFLFLNAPETTPSQVKVTFDLRAAPLESQKLII